MSTIYLLSENKIPDISQIKDVLSPHYSLQSLTGLDDLREALKGESQAVVLSAKGLLKASQLQSVLSAVAWIEVSTQEAVEAVSAPQFESDFLLSPMTRFDILSRVSTAFRQAELLANMETTAQLDEVTQLYNRRYFLNRLNEEISMSKRHLSPLACVIIGVDFFKLYSDSYGYEFVNEMVCRMTEVVQEHKRNEDIIARIGDDEIALLLPRSTEKGAKILAERIVQSIRALDFKSGGNTESLSVYSGISGFPLPEGEKTLDADALVRYARHALHNARCSSSEEGKAGVAIFTEIKPAI